MTRNVLKGDLIEEINLRLQDDNELVATVAEIVLSREVKFEPDELALRYVVGEKKKPES